MSNPLYDRLFGAHAANERPFLIHPDGSTLSYAAFAAMSGRFANAIAAAGLVAGDRLAVQIPKSAEALAVYAACARSG
ncbi:MAG: AMP-binding protein, partial [Pseudomonadota bacterium]